MSIKIQINSILTLCIIVVISVILQGCNINSSGIDIKCEIRAGQVKNTNLNELYIQAIIKNNNNMQNVNIEFPTIKRNSIDNDFYVHFETEGDYPDKHIIKDKMMTLYYNKNTYTNDDIMHLLSDKKITVTWTNNNGKEFIRYYKLIDYLVIK